MKASSFDLWLSRSYDRHASILKAVFLRMLGDEEMAETALLDLFVDLWRDQNVLQEEVAPLGLLAERARRQALKMPRNVWRNHAMHFHAGPIGQNGGTQESALDLLAPRQRWLVEGLFFEGKQISDLARERGVPREWVRSSLDRALQMLMRSSDPIASASAESTWAPSANA